MREVGLLKVVAVLLALCTVGLLWAPWMHVREEPLCVRSPCPPEENRMANGLESSGVFVAFAAVAAAACLFVRGGTVQGPMRVVGASLSAGGAFIAGLWPEGPTFLIFAEYTGRAWGAWSALAICAALILVLATAATQAKAPSQAPATMPQ